MARLFLCFLLTSYCLTSAFRIFNVTYNDNDEGVGLIVKSIYNGSVPPIYWDWRDQKMVSPVKNQLSCNACWAFSAVANIESHLKIYTGREEILSEQFLIDCDGRRIGCGPGKVLDTFARIVTVLGGVLHAEDYTPYAARLLQCEWTGLPRPVPVVGFRRVKSDEEIMKLYLYQFGPLSTGINSASMTKYTGGIDEPTDESCSPLALDHAVLIVGYNLYVDPNTSKVTPYWIIKNSWGPEWGDGGFYYLVRGRNACGVANDVSFSIVQ